MIDSTLMIDGTLRVDSARRIARTRWCLWRHGRRIARSGLFDAAWYARRYADAIAPGTAPLLDFVGEGHRAGRCPNPVFDTIWYRTHYLGGNIAINPLVDYLRRGAAARQPNRWFDPIWYARRNAVSPRQALAHYLAAGAAALETSADDRIASMVREQTDLAGHGTPLGLYTQEHMGLGEIGTCNAWYANGWAWSRDRAPLVLRVFVNDVEQGSVTGWYPRTDVHASLGLDATGFVYEFPHRLSHDDVIEFRDRSGLPVYRMTRTYRVPALGEPSNFFGARAAIAATFLSGRGVEVGAFHMPTDLPPDRDVAFYDRFPIEKLREFHDHDSGRPLMAPAFIGDAETLDGLADDTFDFLIANHVIEHLQDPIRFLKCLSAKLVPGGRAMIAAPDKRFTFDSERALTTFEHHVEDHEQGPQSRQYAHFLEWATVGCKLEGAAAEAVARSYTSDTVLMHYHVWDAETFFDFVSSAIKRFSIPLTTIYSSSTEFEVTVVLEKTA